MELIILLEELKHLGTDIRFDFASGDWSLLPAGDIYSCSADKLVLQDVWLRLVTPRGSLWCHPEYGIDIYDYLHAEDNHINRMGIRAAVREEVMKDPRVIPESVDVKYPVFCDVDSIEVEVSFEIEGVTNRQNFILGYDLRDISTGVVRGVLN